MSEHERFEQLRQKLIQNKALTDEEVALLRSHGEECEQCLSEIGAIENWGDLAEDPRLKPLVDANVARLKKELAVLGK